MQVNAVFIFMHIWYFNVGFIIVLYPHKSSPSVHHDTPIGRMIFNLLITRWLYISLCLIYTQKAINESFSCVCVIQWESKVQQGERDFEQISKNIRRELGRFEVSSAVTMFLKALLKSTTGFSEPSVSISWQKDRVKDFKVVILKYLESLVHTQQQVSVKNHTC